ncbi:MAG: aminotransferase class I/II-fold pyridoxal phosphate-dependent enzyme [Myxococcota bacterium]|nr:aminotransferase class I/II-fold pyridoxal phosphate-dependent enzyme [Myxococcota bacterium]MDP6242431.1 aminotransferase class I/II-fold pyridoxal phosphate-dependent enzyme [Myxococcota bacterium]MDP7076455.1 aminotransferase class I/II-fold pyridoxal phosphate-dependent enzyme [Myxococcota bacterium]MDP7298042.1 aminotransferase class I/II-fold pyridoxal phosphate-dependent enzyme [Myxococcota bacterium]MDP7431678.1 aminotransferase class I/II-fold pyridoxal phosphate-dependent enzyme [M
MRHDFDKLNRLPPYILAEVIDLMKTARREGEDIIDLGMGNPDLPTPPHVVEKICEASRDPRNHRYSASRGIPNLRAAITEWYQRRHGVSLDPEREAIAVIGAKEGLSHFVLMTVGPGDVVLCPDPAYPIHQYSTIIAGGDLRHVPLTPDTDFISNLEQAMERTWPKPKLMILSFPHNPTTVVVDRGFFERVIAFAREHDLMVIHDFAYAEICFDGYQAPSILEVPGAKDVAIEFTSLSKSHSMAGWRVGFACGNPDMIHALGRIKSYLDYGMPQAIQIGAIVALRGPQDVVTHNEAEYRLRRDALVEGLGKPGEGCWKIEKPLGTMFVWARIPEPFESMGSLEFSKRIVREAGVAVSPGIGFGANGEGYVRFALIENRHRIRQAVRGIRRFLRDAGVGA